MFAVFMSCLFCFLPVSWSAPLSCENLLRPLDQIEPQRLKGRWAMVAVSLEDPAVQEVLRRSDSVTLDFYNASYTQSHRDGDVCHYYPRNISVDGSSVKIQVGSFNFTGTVFSTSCLDCYVFTLLLKTSTYQSQSLNLLSKRREIEQKEMEEFRAQTECLKLPPPVEMHPTKELCPEQTGSTAEEGAEGQSA